MVHKRNLIRVESIWTWKLKHEFVDCVFFQLYQCQTNMNISLPLSSFWRCTHTRAQSKDIILPVSLSVCLSMHSTLQNYYSNLLKFDVGLYVRSFHMKYLLVGYISVHCYGQVTCNSVQSWICRKPLFKTILYRPRKLRCDFVFLLLRHLYISVYIYILYIYPHIYIYKICVNNWSGSISSFIH